MWVPHSVMEENKLDHVSAVKRSHSWIELSQVIKNRSFMIMFNANGTGKCKTHGESRLSSNEVVAVHLLNLQRDNSLLTSSRWQSSNCKEVLQPT